MANLRCVAGVHDSKQLSDDQISCILGPHDVYDGSSIISWPKTVVVALVRSWTLVGQKKKHWIHGFTTIKKIVAMSLGNVVSTSPATLGCIAPKLLSHEAFR